MNLLIKKFICSLKRWYLTSNHFYYSDENICYDLVLWKDHHCICMCVFFFSFSLLFRSVHFDSCQKCIYISSNVSFHSVMLLYVFFPSLFNVRFSLLCALRYIPKYIISWNIPDNSSYIYLLFSTEECGFSSY